MAVNVYAGDLRFKVIFKAPISVQNDEGGLEVTYPLDSLTTFGFKEGYRPKPVTLAFKGYSDKNEATLY